jgi:copper chaperone CopZ
MKEGKRKTGWALVGAVIAAGTASLCCILPLVAAGLGVTGFAASELFERWRPYLLAMTFGILAVGFYLAYRRPRESCEVGSACERTPIGRWNRAVLWLVAVLVIVLAAFPYYSPWMVRAVAKNRQATTIQQSSEAHVTLNVDGMVCATCAALLQKKLSQMPGVRRAEVSFEKKQATLDYDPRAVDVSRFTKAITDVGYKVTGQSTVGN